MYRKDFKVLHDLICQIMAFDAHSIRHKEGTRGKVNELGHRMMPLLNNEPGAMICFVYLQVPA